jgi:DNA processing protein
VISIVGTRTPTDYGKSMTRELIEQLAASHPDILIVSGLAYGIDVCAHKASLKHNLDTVGVLGHGLSTIYPAPHRDIAREIAEKGGLLTEFLHKTKPDAPNFVKRNRIVAGMADATLVVESGPEGGALITADLANSYNRDVFAFPGKVNDRMSSGCNRLIKTNRAALVENMEDICYIMDWKKEVPGAPVQKELFVHMNDEERQIAGFLKNEKCATIDILAIRCDMPVNKVSASLLNMEFKGMVKCLPGRVYQLL